MRPVLVRVTKIQQLANLHVLFQVLCTVYEPPSILTTVVHKQKMGELTLRDARL